MGINRFELKCINSYKDINKREQKEEYEMGIVNQRKKIENCHIFFNFPTVSQQTNKKKERCEMGIEGLRKKITF